MSVDVDNMPESGGEITDDDKLWSLLGYIFGLIALIAVLMEDKKNRPFIKYNAVHALMLAVLVVLLSWTGCLWILPWVYGIYLGFKAYQGETIVIPVLTDFAKQQGWV
jgi:uncharacterized membrane protein